MSAEAFKLPGSSYPELCKIVQAYGRHSVPTSNDDVGKIAAVHPTIVSRNNGFLSGVGVLEGGQKKVLTALGRELSKALEHEMPDEIRTQWRSIVESTAFLQNLLAAIRIRKGMDEGAALSHIAYTANVAKSASAKTGATTVLEILRAAELVMEREGKIVAGADQASRLSLPSALDGNPPIKAAPSFDQPEVVSLPLTPPSAGISINIQISVNCEPEDLDALGPRLRRVVREALSQQDSEASGE